MCNKFHFPKTQAHLSLFSRERKPRIIIGNAQTRTNQAFWFLTQHPHGTHTFVIPNHLNRLFLFPSSSFLLSLQCNTFHYNYNQKLKKTHILSLFKNSKNGSFPNKRCRFVNSCFVSVAAVLSLYTVISDYY